MRCVLSVLVVLALCACATPHRKTESTHTVEAFTNRPDGLISREEWRDKDSGGALFLFVDPASQGMCIRHTNQLALGGGSWMVMAPFSAIVDSNLVPAIAATGTAAGNVIGAAVKAAVK
jgi:hypothetical protein